MWESVELTRVHPWLSRDARSQMLTIKFKKNHPAVAPFRCLAAMPHEGGTRTGILPGRPSLDRGINSLSNHLGHLTPADEAFEVSGFHKRTLDSTHFLAYFKCLVPEKRLTERNTTAIFRTSECESVRACECENTTVSSYLLEGHLVRC
ncbi:hypothetical protein T265_00415 [Opisthorchis viverrini]|uniref:Uncharacterized protein n=1 Tax=Opisthorchis viverrini TaxID=6198 RepID=A0A075A5Z9_OPIVI|nr:hypothetical protein T265_00415 [Opisthorchis viverrini]KER33727.1 hypothetical protein T265_00415 [Opisthorchis viverrini]